MVGSGGARMETGEPARDFGGCDRLRALLTALAPGTPRPKHREMPLLADECRWLLAGVEAGLFRFQECRVDCPRRRRHGIAGRDEFLNHCGRPRHLYSDPQGPSLRLNREYIPHIAAHSRAVLELGYPRELATFSEYRTFQHDTLAKRRGSPYELDSSFRAIDGTPVLHLEVKAWPHQLDRIARAIDATQNLATLPLDIAKEVAYVLDLTPRYLWLAGPGTIDPEAHVWRVAIEGHNARFMRVPQLPGP